MDNASLKTEPCDKLSFLKASIVRRSVPLILLVLVVLQFSVVAARTVLGETALWLDESVVYAHVMVIVLGAAWGLTEDRHVRIDALKTMVSSGFQRKAERIGLIATVVASVGVILLSLGFVSASWRMLEGSPEVSGLPGIFLLKTLVPLLFILLGIAALQRLRTTR